MKLTINGEEKIFDFNSTEKINLDYFLKINSFKSENIAIAINLKFIPKSEYHSTYLEDGDDIEILTPMQGG